MPIHLAFSYDEEVGCTGVRPMIAELGKRLPLPRMVFVGEPTSMAVVDAHKGPVRWRVEVTGRRGPLEHAALGVNAIAYAGASGRAGRDRGRAARHGRPDPRFDPPSPHCRSPQIEGGTASNIVPVPCWFGWEIRGLPGFDPSRWMPLEAVRGRAVSSPKCGALLPEAGSESGPDEPGRRPTRPIRSLRDCSARLEAGAAEQAFAVSYCTEAGLFQAGGAPAIVCGPGNIAQAHTANEFLSLDELEKCLLFLGRLADWAEA